MPTTDADWDAMAARGFSVVRLVVTWSRIEPERGRIDESYLDQIDTYVRAAAARGIYTVIDMHQDAYSSFIATTDASTCPPGTQPGKGWDGAPRWATITDGLSTCITRERNDSPAVVAAWNHFYDDTDGIRQRFTASWAAVAARFAGRPEVAGYDLLNEPEVSRPGAELTPRYDDLVADTVTAIRDAEAKAGAPFRHLVFVEPAIPAGNPSFGLVVPDPKRIGLPPDDIVAAPHNYAEAITEGATIEEMNELFVSVATGLGVPVWIGEHGFWDTEPATLAKLDRFARDQDRRVLGGAWWQWRQPCGDPHSISWGGWAGKEPDDSTHLNGLACPGDRDLGPTDAFLRVVGRAYPRVAPGRITALESEHASGRFSLAAEGAAPGAELWVWTPTSADTHTVSSTGLGPVDERTVPGGRLLRAAADGGTYSLQLTPR
jgi:endoglycosylceramidase